MGLFDFDRHLGSRQRQLANMVQDITGLPTFCLEGDLWDDRNDIARILDWNFDEPPYFVEAEGEKNVSIYKHFGFEVVGEYQAPQTNETLVGMLRRPKPLLR